MAEVIRLADRAKTGRSLAYNAKLGGLQQETEILGAASALRDAKFASRSPDLRSELKRREVSDSLHGSFHVGVHAN